MDEDEDLLIDSDDETEDTDLTDEELDDLDDDDDQDDDGEVVEEALPSKTYAVVNGRITGVIDGMDAVVQAIDKILKTNRFVNMIYSEQYGNDLDELVGEDFAYVEADIERVLQEALQADDRIDDVSVLSIRQTGRDSVEISVSVTTAFGSTTLAQEVQV